MLHKDLREFIELLISHGVDFLLVGGHAVAFHGHPRYTGDIDILIRPGEANVRSMARVLVEFGFEPTRAERADQAVSLLGAYGFLAAAMWPLRDRGARVRTGTSPPRR